MLTQTARAKINLGLEILGRRPNGYHELITILQEIDLADRLTFVDAEDLTLECDRPEVPLGSDNLVLRAARLLRRTAGVGRGARIYLEKAIPVAAGLGGGSSDAAATLIGLNQLWGVNGSMEDLDALAREIGTDVAFFLRGGTQIATGAGDELDAVPTPRLWVAVVAVRSPYGDKTRRLYSALRPADWSDGREVRAIAAELRKGGSLSHRTLPSSFNRVARELIPEVIAAFASIERANGAPALCGAGPSVIALHDTANEARQVVHAASQDGLVGLVASTVSSSGRALIP